MPCTVTNCYCGQTDAQQFILQLAKLEAVVDCPDALGCHAVQLLNRFPVHHMIQRPAVRGHKQSAGTIIVCPVLGNAIDGFQCWNRYELCSH